MNFDPSLPSRLAQSGVTYAPQIVNAAKSHGVDPALLAAVAAQETGGPGSNGGRNVVGDGGHGHGLFQIDDRWHDFAKTAAAMDPAKNADYAAGMISGLLKRYGGNVREALSAYNAGDPHAGGTRTTWGDGTTLGYADSVMRHYALLTGGPPAASEAIETARADAPEASERVNTLLAMANAFTQPLPSVSMPSMPQRSRAPSSAIDATGHCAADATSYDAYINGDDL
jgi:Transglycosylase SLT domain